jgi:hypothetical protein
MRQEMTPKISQLFIYPIKSCAGISVQSFQFDNRGPVFDRYWMLVDADSYIFLSQRTVPKMALISTRIDNENVWASVQKDGQEQSFLLPQQGQLTDVTVWEDEVQGYDCGDEAASWFSHFLQRDCRLIYQGNCSRKADTEFVQLGTQVSYADGFPLLVVAQSSLDFLDAACDARIGAENFRPNIVIENTPPFAEDDWQNLTTDGVKMAVVKPCQRCVIPALNPITATREASIMPVLIEHCRKNKKIIFGQNLTFICEGEGLKVGQQVRI